MINTEDYWERRLSENFNEKGVGFSYLGDNYNRWLYRLRQYVFSRLLDKYSFSREGRVLDIGSGTGFYVKLWQDYGIKDLLGIDITETSVTNLDKEFPAYEFLKLDIGNDINKLDLLGKNMFDVISAMDVLFHIVNDYKYKNSFHNVYKLLKKGGYFIFSENFVRKRLDYDHIVHRSEQEITKLVEEVGFSIVDRKPMFYFMNYPVDTNSKIIKKNWSIISKLISKNRFNAYYLGLLLYSIDLLMVNILNSSPTTELMVCKK